MNEQGNDRQRFSGKSVIVTGAASGMGRASALRFGAQGAAVWCADINSEGAAETAAVIKEAGGNAIGEEVVSMNNSRGRGQFFRGDQVDQHADAVHFADDFFAEW